MFTHFLDRNVGTQEYLLFLVKKVIIQGSDKAWYHEAADKTVYCRSLSHSKKSE